MHTGGTGTGARTHTSASHELRHARRLALDVGIRHGGYKSEKVQEEYRREEYALNVRVWLHALQRERRDDERMNWSTDD